MAKQVKNRAGKVVHSKNAVRRAEAARKLLRGRPRAEWKHPQLLDFQYLDTLYWKEGKSLQQIADGLEVSRVTVRSAMVKLGITFRPRGDRGADINPRKKAPRSQRRIPSKLIAESTLTCPTCGIRAWYLPANSDTWLCNQCQTWFDIRLEDGHLVAREAQLPD